MRSLSGTGHGGPVLRKLTIIGLSRENVFEY